MNKNGFTLVEIMIIVVIIGILASMSMPRLHRAADKAKAAEAPQILTAIAGAQEAYRLKEGEYLSLTHDAANTNWKLLGLNVPEKKYFEYTASATTGSAPTNPTNPLDFGVLPKFTAAAKLVRTMRSAELGSTIEIKENGEKTASSQLNLLIPSFGAKPK